MNISRLLYSNTLRQAVKYGIVGLLNTVLCYAIYWALVNFDVLHYSYANVIQYGVGFILSFYLNSKWTFKSENTFRHDAFWFSLIFLISFGVQYIALILFTEKFNMDPRYAQLPATVMFTLTNFTANKWITFR